MIRQIRKFIANSILAFNRSILKTVWPGYSRILRQEEKIHEISLMVRSLVREQISLDSGERLVPDNPDNPDSIDYIEDSHRKRYEFACSRIKDGSDVLDIACGAGYGSYMMSQNPKISVTGVDISANAVEHAKKYYKRKNLQFICSDANNYTPAADKQFDVIVSFETVEHIELDLQFINRISAFLKPGGILMVSTPNIFLLPEPFAFHYRHYSPKRMTYILKKFGNLKTVEIYGQSKPQKYNLCRGFLHSYLGEFTVHIARKT